MHWATRIMEQLGYPGIVFVVLIENIFPPLPSELILPFAGYMVTLGSFSFLGVVVSATIGSLLGALILYEVSRLWGMERIYSIAYRFRNILRVSEQQLQQTEYWFERYGPAAVLIGRMVPVVRSLISVPAGLTNMKRESFLLYSAVGAFGWNFILSGIGVALGAAWPLAAEWIGIYQNIVIVTAGLASVLFLWHHWR